MRQVSDPHQQQLLGQGDPGPEVPTTYADSGPAHLITLRDSHSAYFVTAAKQILVAANSPRPSARPSCECQGPPLRAQNLSAPG